MWTTSQKWNWENCPLQCPSVMPPSKAPCKWYPILVVIISGGPKDGVGGRQCEL